MKTSFFPFVISTLNVLTNSTDARTHECRIAYHRLRYDMNQASFLVYADVLTLKYSSDHEWNSVENQ